MPLWHVYVAGFRCRFKVARTICRLQGRVTCAAGVEHRPQGQVVITQQLQEILFYYSWAWVMCVAQEGFHFAVMYLKMEPGSSFGAGLFLLHIFPFSSSLHNDCNEHPSQDAVQEFILSQKMFAGRVQSVALRLCCEREVEASKFNPEEYWSIAVQLGLPGNKVQKVLPGTRQLRPLQSAHSCDA